MNANNGNSTIPRHIRNNESYTQAVAFMQNAHAKDGVEYDWILDYAKALWDERRNHFAALDDKADSIIKYLGGGLGLFSAGVLAKVDASNAYLLGWTFPALACAVVSLFLAAWVRKPNSTPTLPPIEAAVSCAEEGKNEKESQAIFLGQWNLICEGHRLANRDKSQKLALATIFYCLSLALLTLPLFIVFINRHETRPAHQAGEMSSCLVSRSVCSSVPSTPTCAATSPDGLACQESENVREGARLVGQL